MRNVRAITHDQRVQEPVLLYQRVEQAIRKDIQSGQFPPFSQLPKEDKLAELHMVSRVTIRAALARLAADGFLQRVKGKGTFVAERVQNTQVSSRFAEVFADSNIVDLTPYNIGLFALPDMLVDLNPFLKTSSVLNKSDFYPELLKPFTFNGKLLGLPVGFGSMMTHGNMDACRSLGIDPPDESWTVADLESAARKTARFDVSGRLVQQFGNLFPWPLCVWVAGGENLDVQNQRLLLDSPESTEGLRLYQRLYHVGRALGTHDQERQAFVEGKVPVYFGTRTPDSVMNRLPFRWVQMPIPMGKIRATWTFMRGFGLLRAAQQPDAEWRRLEDRVRRELDAGQTPAADHCPAIRSPMKTGKSRKMDIHALINRQHVASLAYGRFVHTTWRAESMKPIFRLIEQLEFGPKWVGDDQVRRAVAEANQISALQLR